jgi:hypothetical protein
MTDERNHTSASELAGTLEDLDKDPSEVSNKDIERILRFREAMQEGDFGKGKDYVADLEDVDDSSLPDRE